jgi:hypothetical protein
MPWHTPLHAGTRRRRALRALVVTGPPVEAPRATLRVAHNGAAERLPGWALEPRMGITAFPVAPRWPSSPRVVRFSRRNASALLSGTSAGGEANSDREASAAGECRRGGAGAGIGRASARCLATERGGRSPPRVKTGGRSAEHPHRRQNSRASPPAVEQPRLSARWQIGRAPPPAAEQPGISTGGRTAAPLRTLADRPSTPTGGRTAEHLHRRQIRRATPPAADRRVTPAGLSRR